VKSKSGPKVEALNKEIATVRSKPPIAGGSLSLDRRQSKPR
jgi:hypothetical protein